MNSTPNYGFKEEVKICAIDAIDRELKRVENLARCKSGIDKCEFDQHLANANAHKELFDKKVDKEEGHGLISEKCLKQICENKNGLVLLEQYIQELRERNEQLEAELANKANIAVPHIYNFEMLEGYQPYTTNRCYYQKNDNGLVIMGFEIICDDEEVFAPRKIHEPFVLPAGFRPSRMVRIAAPYATTLYTNRDTPPIAGALGCYIFPMNVGLESGAFRIYTALENVKYVSGTVAFYTAQ